ncbi:MAG: site-specific DNA-methyltransferase, partial [Caldilineaceae bacterium]|nr:site-specific DNA-methyltransferase [Caldilineaceae bacterium]
MTTLVAQIAPQRSTQYADLARHLAPLELQLSCLGATLSNLDLIELAGQSYLRFDLPSTPDADQLAELGSMAMTNAFFVYHPRIGDVDGPFLQPLANSFTPAFPPELAFTRRYRGKTNELFTHFLCNLARGGSGMADQPWSALRIFDPLAGGGTTLFTALMLGAEAVGVEQNQQDMASSATYLTQFMRERGIACKVKEERLKKLGRRWSFT